MDSTLGEKNIKVAADIAEAEETAPEGKKPMDAIAFANGRNLKVNDKIV